MISTDSACPVVPVLTVSYCAVVGVASGVAGHDAVDAAQRFEDELHSPKTAAGEHDALVEARGRARRVPRHRRKQEGGGGEELHAHYNALAGRLDEVRRIIA